MKYKEIDLEIRRGLCFDIPSYKDSLKTQGTWKEIWLEILRGLTVYIPSQMSIENAGEYRKIDFEIRRRLCFDIPSYKDSLKT